MILLLYYLITLNHNSNNCKSSNLKMLLLIDNYDSFTYNLVQYFGDLGHECKIIRNDDMNANEAIDLNPEAVILSPGPGNPDSAGICLDIVKKCEQTNTPLFGVCLGLQTIGQVYGGNITRAPEPVHGKTDLIFHEGHSVFKNVPSPLKATRYHSLIIDRNTCPEELEITAWTSDDLIMGIKHKTKPFHAVQFHPESIETENGHNLLKNFIDIEL